QQLDRFVAVWRVGCNASAGNVHQRAAIFAGGEDHLDRIGPGLLLVATGARRHQPVIIGLGHSDVADAGGNVAGTGTVATSGNTGLIGLEPFEPGAGLVLAMLGDIGGNHGGVVGVLTRADAEAVAPFLVGELLIGNGVEAEVLGRIDHAS